MDRHRMSGYSELEPEHDDETEKRGWRNGRRQEGNEGSDEDLKCFHYWLSDASVR